MKKILSTLIAAAMLLSLLAGCGGSGGTADIGSTAANTGSSSGGTLKIGLSMSNRDQWRSTMEQAAMDYAGANGVELKSFDSNVDVVTQLSHVTACANDGYDAMIINEKVKKFMSTNPIWLVLLVMCVAMAIASATFVTKANIMSVLMRESIIGILAVGVMWTILSKGIDLSPGAIVGLTSVVSASMAQRADYASKLFPNMPDMPVMVPIIVALAVGTLFGVLNGLLIAYTKIPPFIATLGTQLIARACAQLCTNTYPIPELKDGFKALGQRYIIPGFLPTASAVSPALSQVS